MTFEDIQGLLDDTERDVLTNIVEKHPELKKGWMRQNDYSRKLDEIREKSNQFEEISQYASSWQNWAESNWDFDHKTTKAELALRQQVEELRNKQGEEMTFDQINEFLQKEGIAKKSDIEQTIKQKEEELARNFQGNTYFHLKMQDLGEEYRHEFKKPFKSLEFAQKLTEWGVNDIDQGFNRYVSDIREEQRNKEFERKLEEARKEAEEKGRMEAINSIGDRTGNSSFMPVDGSSNDMGYLQSKVQGDTPNFDVTKPTAALAAREFMLKQSAT